MKKTIKIFSFFIGYVVPVFCVVKWQQKCIDRWREQAGKNRAMFILMNQWTNLRQEGRNLEEYFLKNGYARIAVYGMGAVGQRLVKELRNSKIEVVYGIDKNRDNIYSKIKVITMEERFTDIDAVVVTVVKEFDTIREALLKKIDCPVIAIEDILDEF